MKRTLVLLALGVVLYGCSGFGGSSVLVVPLKLTEPTILVGWTWGYDCTGTFTPTGGSAKTAIGSRSFTVTNVTGTQVTEAESLTLVTSTTQTTYTKMLVYTQAVDGSLTLVSVQVGNNPVRIVQTTNFAIPGTWSATTNVVGDTTYTDTSIQHDLLQVTGTARVTTPVATFNTFVTTRQLTFNGVLVQNYVQNQNPGIVHPPVATGTEILSDGAFTGTFTLQTTNVPLPQ